MNNQSPLVPHGSFLEQKQKGRARVKIAVFVVLAVHGVGLLALLVQGCNKDDSKTGGGTNSVTNAAANPTFVEPVATNTVVASSSTSATPSAVAATPEAPKPASAEMPPMPTITTDYKIQAGDNFSVLSKKFHVTTKALLEANPGVEPTKLQVNQVIHIPPPAVATTSAPMGGTGAAPAAVDTATGEAVYSVKSGDTLTSIAHEKKVSLKDLRSANSLKTDSIKVGQKLKIPKTARAAADSTASSASIVVPTATYARITSH